jgi:acetyl esterase
VRVVGTRYAGQVHGFWRHVDVFDAAEPLTRQVAGFLQQHA